MLYFIFSTRLNAQSKIYGRITDENNKPIMGTTVLLLHSEDSLLAKGTVTNNNGEYSFEKINQGSYFITSSFTGFETVSSGTFYLSNDNDKIDNGTFKMKTTQSVLKDVTVKSTLPLFEQKPDRLIINVASSITAAGNTALQVLERSPGVFVNRQNNTISILGKDGVKIMINGKQNYMPADAVVQMLDGMSAGNIDKIELITTPPANFDAEGNAGYINIVLKQNDNVGTNGSYSATLGYGEGLVTQANLNFNHRKGKINLYGDISYSRVKNPFTINGYNRISNAGNIYESFGSDDRTDTTRQHNIRLGLDFQASSHTILGILFTSNGRWYRQSELTTNSFYNNGILDTTQKGNNSELNNWQDYGINLNLQQDLRKNENLSFNATYLHYKNNQPFNYYNMFYDNTENFIYGENTKSGKITPLDFLIFALDYNKKLSEKISIEAGIKSTVAKFKNESNFEKLVQDDWKIDPSLSSIYTLNENYAMAYISGDIKVSEKTTIKGGLRFEFTNSNLGSEEQKNIVDRHYGNFFPTIYLTQKLDENNTINFSFNTRISRPTFNDLAPFTYYSSRNNLITGNPALQPAISNTIKIEYAYKRYLLWVSFSSEKNTITGFQPHVDSLTNKTISTPENLKNQKMVTAVLSIPVSPAKWWNMQYNITGLWQQVNAMYDNEPVRIEEKNIMINMSQSFTLPKNFFIELSGFYRSPGLDGISLIKSFGSLDFGVKKKFGTKDVLAFSANNLLNSQDIRIHTNLPDLNLVGDVNLRFSWRTFKLTYTHNFGKNKLKASRNRNTGAEDEKERVKYQ